MKTTAAAIGAFLVAILGCGGNGDSTPPSEPEVAVPDAFVEAVEEEEESGVASWSCKCGLACGQPDGTFEESAAEFIICKSTEAAADEVAAEAVGICNEEMLAQGCTADENTASSCMCIFVVDYCEDEDAR